MVKIEENDKVIPWLLNSNLHKVKIILSHIGPETLKFTLKKFEKIMLQKFKALDSRARQEIEAYYNVANVTEYQIYKRLRKIDNKLKKVCNKLKNTYKVLVEFYFTKLYLRPRVVKKLVIKTWMIKSTQKSRAARHTRAVKRENKLVKLETVVFEMLSYMKKFGKHVQGKAKGLYNPTFSRSVFLRMDAVDRDSETSRSAIKVATELELKTAIAMLALPPGLFNTTTPIMIDDTLDQKSAAELVEQALADEFPAERLIIPEALRVRVEAKMVQKY